MILFGKKKLQYYKGILIKADLNLHEQIAEQLSQLRPPTTRMRVLDLGAGEGALSQRLNDLGYSVVAVDKNQEDFKCTDVPFLRVDLNQEDEIRELQNKLRDSFDIVLGVEVIEHLENPWEYVRLLKSLLKQNGLILITTPNISSWYSRLIFLRNGRFHQFQEGDLAYGHIAPITPWELRVILEKEDISDVRIIPAGTLPDFWFVPSIKYLIINVVGLLFRIFMRGITGGWCVLVTGIKG